ncbi:MULTISPECIES: type II toxin-antitoxin system RelE/ParE family toxin [Vibrio harveyi group]|uniref:Type II toxin-antitoxin system mRNA interferase toxin, RelE/StbE family n=1 Tax=Vibrio alginolyticus TaxID=663 RepID=A0AA36UVE2_VIBAL|nr:MULTISPECIES: type II toxin-antitoxin system mRNA interferase toxin, RelE/StbE family [Vibrio harveyi group]EGQ9137736.1 type II toxin-antitoxin system mRNA interferase toxin, RelE/StbE family [Vibrio alginolyticus]EHA1205739.1 type II toxin-antitoxin system mRNA interferase toxin, RelE/StbE family [Vibrio alginolyticus]KOE02087.1 plasmid stabilization protein ParE [Vibrio alginolyticus]MCR9328858.1 type II toxin-antitoxin system mRNA interferase toxin, RelE/StbE family [Vibrio alginolyticus
MILWEEESLNDREKIFEFIYDFNPDAAEKTDNLIEAKVENLLEQPLMGVQRDGVRGRLLIISEISMTVSYWIEGDVIRIMSVLHQKQKFPMD